MVYRGGLDAARVITTGAGDDGVGIYDVVMSAGDNYVRIQNIRVDFWKTDVRNAGSACMVVGICTRVFR